MTTSAPSAAKRLTMPAPGAPTAPVAITVLRARRLTMVLLCGCVRVIRGLVGVPLSGPSEDPRYSPECVERRFSEDGSPLYGFPRSSAHLYRRPAVVNACG